MKFKPAEQIRTTHFSGEYSGINPSIADSSTFTFPTANAMAATFAGETDYFLYTRHSSPSATRLSQALAAMEGTESATVTASGMGAITPVLLQLCKEGDEIVASRTIYGGTYAFLKNFLPRLGIHTRFVDFTRKERVSAAITSHTRLLYCETVSNPLLETINLHEIAGIAHQNNATLVVDNTFSPLSITPSLHGADIIIHSLTKFINGASDGVGGVICSDTAFIASLKDVTNGACMLLGSTLDSFRAASIYKNMQTLPLRIKKHSENAMYLARKLSDLGIRVFYPGLPNHPSHKNFQSQMNEEFGYGGMLGIDVGTLEKAGRLMELLQKNKLGYLAVSLGYYHTLFSASGSSTSSEIPEEERKEMGLSEGLIRFSIGLDNDIKATFRGIADCLKKIGITKSAIA